MEMADNVELGILDIRKLCSAIKSSQGFDFDDYALSSFKRRISRILNIGMADSVDDLVHKIKSDNTFFNTFLKELTVNVTEMFRDPSFWREMRDKILPNISFDSSIFIWHAGCASGDEVFSMVILLKEAGLLDKTRIVATDINEQVLTEAKSGFCPGGKMELNAANYERFNPDGDFRSYFKMNKDEKNATLNPELMNNVRFNSHDLAQGDPFSKFHIILCRNVLIYFNQHLQDKVTTLFDVSLMNKGYLALGTKESLIWSSIRDRYNSANEKEKIYQKQM